MQSSQQPAARVGSQEPRVRIEPKAEWTEGDNAIAMVSKYCFKPFPWQEELLRCWLSRDASGRFAVATAGLSVPRQNGKNGALEGMEFYLLCMVPNTHILHTAHQVKTEHKSFLRLKRYFERGPKEIARLVEKVSNVRGEEGITLANGNTIEYAARSKNGARGFDNITLLVYDEAQALTPEHVEALVATLAASKSERMVIYMGTPPAEDVDGHVFRDVRRRALTNPSPRTAWHEWGVAEVGDIEDRDRWYEANPSMGLTLSEEWTEDTELSSMTQEGFARERLGWWDDSADEDDYCVDRDRWAAALCKDPPKDGIVCFGVKFATNGRAATIAACIRPDDGGPLHVEVAAHATNGGDADWAFGKLAPKFYDTAQVIVDGKAHSEDLAQLMRDAKAPKKLLVQPNASEVADACAMFAGTVQSGRVTHFGQSDLTLSATGCTKRPIGKAGGWGFDGGGKIDETYAEAAALACYAARKTKRDPRRKARVL